MSKARSLADLISGGAVIEASEIADSTITGSKLASDIAITTTGTISTPSIIGLSSLTIENVNIDNNSITSIASNIEQVSYTSVTTNILLYSQTYSNSYWNKANSSITENATTAPDGTTTASKFNENTVNTQHRVIRSSLVTGVAASKTFTFSSHFKAAERSAVKMEIYADGQAVTSYALFGLSGDGTVGDTFAVDSTAITSVGNGWYRCSITRTVNSSASGLRVYHITATGTSNGDDSYAGSTSNGIYFWGSQLEEGLITSYLPTTSASLSGITGVTRGVSGTTAATASSGTTITLGSISTTISANIDATQIGIPLASLTGVAASGSAVIGNSNIDLNLSASGTGNVKLGNDEKLVFGDAGENISGDGTSLTITSSHNTVIDSANQIILDARNGANIYFRDDGILIGQVLKSGNNDFKLKALQSGKDLVLEGLDSGGSLVQALTLDMSAAGAATFSDKIILGANKSIELGDPGDRIYGDGTNLQIVSSNALGFDVANGIILDSGSGGTILRAGGSTTYGTLTSNSGDFSINQTTSDKDIIFTGNDGGSAITALTLDMSEAGNATFNADVTVAGNLTVNGTTTTLNTATLDIEDKTLCIAKGAANAAAADGAGIIVDGASACLTFTNSTNSWDFNENVIIQRPSNESTNLIVGNSINNHEIAVCRSGSNPSFVKIQAHTNEPKIMFCTNGTTGGLRFSDPSDNVLMKLTTAGRLGIGTTSPGTALHIVGSGNPTLRIGSSTSTSGNAQIELIGKNSGVDASTATIWADYNGQLNLNSANNVEIRNGNTTSLRVVSNGNIGIGTSSPSSLLHLSSSDPQITITDTDGTGSQIIKAVGDDLQFDVVGKTVIDSDGGGTLQLLDGGTSYLKFFEFGTYAAVESMISDNDFKIRGNDGGVFFDALTLDMSEAGNATFNGDVTVENYLRIDNSGSEVLNIRGEPNYGTLSVGNRTLNLLGNVIKFEDDTFVEKMRMHTNGYIGIGTSSPVSKLTVAGQITATPGATSAPTYSFDNDTNTGISRPTTDAINFVTNGSENMRISSNGAVGINSTATTLPLGTARFVVQGGSSTEYVGIDQYGVITVEKAATGLQYAMEFRNPNGLVGRITTENSATSYNTSSDYRLKENVNYDFDATSRLKQLKPARFNFIADADKTVDGFLAHEVSSVVPEAISGEKDAVNEDGSIQPQGIDQSKLVPLLVKTIQELEARIQTLEGN